MTQIEQIQMNIHEVKIQLAQARRVIPTDEMQKLFKESNIESLLEELKELNFSLECAIANESK